MSHSIPPCLRCQSPLEAGDLRCAVCAGRTPFEVAHREDIISDVLRCQGCGAAVEYDAEVEGLKCAFCDAVLALERIEDPMEQTQSWLPFDYTVPFIVRSWKAGRPTVTRQEVFAINLSRW